MKNITVTIIFILCFFNLKCQVNLVLNPSFEQIDSCLGYYNSGIYRASYWDTLRSGGGGSSDLFNECCTYSSYCGIPLNWQNKGYQYPKTGVGYAGLIATTTHPNVGETREYIQGTLINILLLGHNYCSKIYISFSNRSKYSSASLGVYFDNGQVQSVPFEAPFPYITPQIVNTQTQLDDTLNWVLIEGSFIANGTEEYITIGNFFPDSLSGIMPYPNGTSFLFLEGSYYYIDDISVIDISTPAYAGNDTILLVSDSIYLGRPSEIGLDEACIWFLNGVPIDTVAGIWVVPDSTTTYVLQQTLCGNVQYDTVTVTIDTGTSVEGLKNGVLRIFPNPSSGEVWYSLDEGRVLAIEVFGVDGKLVYQETGVSSLKNNKISYNFEKGVYIVVVRTETAVFRKKVVVW